MRLRSGREGFFGTFLDVGGRAGPPVGGGIRNVDDPLPPSVSCGVDDRSWFLRAILVTCGLANVAIGVAGIVLPGLPATVFFLAAAWCFARSSPRLHRWITGHPRIGPYLEMARTRSMPRRARILTVLTIWAGIGSSLWLRSDAGLWWRLALVAAGLTGTACVVTMRGRVRAQPARPIVR